MDSDKKQKTASEPPIPRVKDFLQVPGVRARIQDMANRASKRNASTEKRIRRTGQIESPYDRDNDESMRSTSAASKMMKCELDSIKRKRAAENTKIRKLQENIRVVLGDGDEGDWSKRQEAFEQIVRIVESWDPIKLEEV